MLRTVLSKGIATIAALGSAAALTVAMAPAASAATYDCAYPAPVVPNTRLSLVGGPIVQYGAVKAATVRVTVGNDAPRGTVTVTVNGRPRTATLNAGRATVSLPRTLGARRTYTVYARFNANGNCAVSRDNRSLTVFRARTHVRRIDAGNIRRGARPVVTGRIAAETGITVPGTVRVQLRHNGRVVQSKSVTLRSGQFMARFGKVKARGSWTAKVIKSRSNNFLGSSRSTTFRVR